MQGLIKLTNQHRDAATVKAHCQNILTMANAGDINAWAALCELRRGLDLPEHFMVEFAFNEGRVHILHEPRSIKTLLNVINNNLSQYLPLQAAQPQPSAPAAGPASAPQGQKPAASQKPAPAGGAARASSFGTPPLPPPPSVDIEKPSPKLSGSRKSTILRPPPALPGLGGLPPQALFGSAAKPAAPAQAAADPAAQTSATSAAAAPAPTP